MFFRHSFKTLWTRPEKIVIVCCDFSILPTTMMLHKPLTLPVLSSFVVFLAGCCSGSGTTPSNPFAQNLQTVPPPATFSSQESYLGQTPGSFVPQTPASTFSPSGSVSPTQSATPSPSSQPLSDAANNGIGGQGATVFAAEKETTWAPVDVASTNNTAFQAMDAKVTSVSTAGNQTDVPESLIVGTSHVVTTIVDEAQPAATLTEPQALYSGKYAE